ncbi:hypothetical protein HAX54_031146 [Datura stramonium]|uniref:Uncharacterized protein n=1 Tax=Datura stramonium TaxID=4076 RepID=A0ABS8V949_DATST|nr:hypothetical protein [Datura stramonium]
MDCVFVYNFISGHGVVGRICRVSRRFVLPDILPDSDRTILVAGGHDDEKNALKSVLSYDVVKDEWFTLPDMVMEEQIGPGRPELLGSSRTSPHTLEGDDGRAMCRDSDVAVKEHATWQKLARLPAGITRVAYLTACQGKLILVGNNAQFDELHSAYALDLQSDGTVMYCDSSFDKAVLVEKPNIGLLPTYCHSITSHG